MTDFKTKCRIFFWWEMEEEGMSQALLVFSGSRISFELLSKEKLGSRTKDQGSRILELLEQDRDWDSLTYISLTTATDWGDIKAGNDLFSSDLKLEEYKMNLIKVTNCFTSFQLSADLLGGQTSWCQRRKGKERNGGRH